MANKAYYTAREWQAKACKTWEECDDYLRMVDDDNNISNYQYYVLKSVAIKATYNHLCGNE